MQCSTNILSVSYSVPYFSVKNNNCPLFSYSEDGNSTLCSSSSFFPILNCLKPNHSNDLSKETGWFIANRDEAQPALCVSHFSYSDQIEWNKMASHSQMGGSISLSSRSFLQQSDNVCRSILERL